MAEDSEFIEVAEKGALTGLYARDFFYRYCEQLDRNIAGEKDAMALDIDRFKLINGLYDKAFGDKVLIKIAEILVDMVRKNNGLVCSPNADTFLI
jgi:diguanylate cyclase (GGDEF)-like protein